MSNEYFINPYTFVPISDSEPERSSVKRGLHTGIIECELEIVNDSPLFIPNTTGRWSKKVFNDEHKEIGEHYSYDFYSYDDLSSKSGEQKDRPTTPPKHPIIPGSEIRGMVRNIYEQLTNSCFLVVDDKNLPFKRSPKPKRAGILEGNKLYPATRYMLNTRGRSSFGDRYATNTFKTGQYVWFTPTDKTYDVYMKEKLELLNKKDRKSIKKLKKYTQIIKKGISLPNGANSVEVKNYDKDSEPDSGRKDGYVLMGEKLDGLKHHDSIMSKNDTGICLKVSDDDIKMLHAVLYDEKAGYDEHEYDDYKEVYQKYMKDKNKEDNQPLPVFYDEKAGYDEHEYDDYKEVYQKYMKDKNKEDNQPLPVFYEEIEGKIYMSPAQMTKEVFANDIGKLLDTDENHWHAPCSKKNEACPACRLFGMIDKNGVGGAIAGRVRFTNAHVLNKDSIVWFKNNDNRWVTLPPLGTPRLSATEFYLKRPKKINKGEGTWNYDYYTEYTDEEDPFASTLYTPKLAGRKVYWHGKYNDQTPKANQLNQTVRMLSKGEFGFKVYYEDLTDTELSNLIFCLDLNDQGIHKIGRGKPIGMGDVKVTVKSVCERTYHFDNTTSTFTTEFSDNIKDKIEQTERNAEVSVILRYTKPMRENADIVKYPEIDDTEAKIEKDKSKVFKWFSSGYKINGVPHPGNRGDTIQQPRIIEVLPEIMDPKQTLPKKIKKIQKKTPAD